MKRKEEQNLIIILCKSANTQCTDKTIYVKHCFDSNSSYGKWCIKSELIKTKQANAYNGMNELIIWQFLFSEGNQNNVCDFFCFLSPRKKKLFISHTRNRPKSNIQNSSNVIDISFFPVNQNQRKQMGIFWNCYFK